MIKKEWITLEEFKEAEKYWRDKLSGELTEPILPIDFPGVHPYERSCFTTACEKDTTEKLLQISKHNLLSLYIVLLTAFKLLLFKYLQLDDIIVASVIYNKNNQEYNKYVVFRNHVPPGITFKNFLMNVKKTVVEGYGNEYYPTRNLIERLGIAEKTSLFRTAFILEDIHEKKLLDHLPEDYKNDIIFSSRLKCGILETDLIYNSSYFKEDTMRRLWNYYSNILRQVLNNPSVIVSKLELNSREEKEKLLFDLNQTGQEYPADKTLHELFQDQVEQNPAATALCAPSDWDAILAGLKSDHPGGHLPVNYENCCFKKIPYVILERSKPFLEYTGIFKEKEQDELKLLRTPKKNYLAVSTFTLHVLELMDGKTNLKSLSRGLQGKSRKVVLFNIERIDTPEVFKVERREILIDGSFQLFFAFAKTMYAFHLLEFAGFSSFTVPVQIPKARDKQKPAPAPNPLVNPSDALNVNPNNIKSPVLLLGDTGGTATTGILYLASYLRRKGIKAHCRWNDVNLANAQLKESIVKLLSKFQPRLVGVSLKWFLHIARVLEICKIVKQHDSSIEVLVGGNTASFYWEQIIKYDCIDEVIIGDGELPLFKICSNENKEHIPNCVFKRNGQVVKTPLSYIQDETNSTDIFLSHLDEIFVSDPDPYFSDYFYINTGKGCSQQCCYCAGCRQVQKKSFNRPKPFLRGIKEVRKDLKAAMPYTTTLMFDFDLPLCDSLAYYKVLWEGIDFSNYFCEFYSWKLPSEEFIQLVSRTFKYVHLGIDVCSVSEPHRLQLESLGLVKPQPRNKEIISLFKKCEGYDNIDVKITQVLGLPFFSREDIRRSEVFLSRLMEYSCFKGMEWSRLHAQPGAPILQHCQTYLMHSYAHTYNDFLHYSQLNTRTKYYPNLETANYPYIYFNDEGLNSRLSVHYSKINHQLEQNQAKIENKPSPIYTRRLTYRQLNEKSNRLARRLRARGVRQGTLVGIMASSSIELVTGILAIQKAGGAYLPVDIEYPQERIRLILKDSTDYLLTTRDLTETHFQVIHHFPPGEKIIIDDETDDTVNSSNLNLSYSSADLAYVIYTSGTTGEPRGILTAHKGVVNYTCWRLKAYNFTNKDVTLQLLSPGFDGYGSNLYSSLLSGGTLVLTPGFKKLGMDELVDIIDVFGVTNTSLVPLIYDALLEAADEKNLESLRFVVLAGEKSRPSLIEKSKKKTPRVKLINEYGPTEASVAAAAHPQLEPTDPSIIGRPIANTVIYLLDRFLIPVPLEVPGEIYISGLGLAKGYVNRPELTANTFIKNPFPPGERMYKTGDVGRWRQEQNLEFLNRIDHQVKIRGYRIELNEIQERLIGHEKIKEAVVVHWQDEIGDSYLTAYFVPVDNTIPEDNGGYLKAYLSRQLPNYMIPSFFTRLEKIPLTLNGKVDRKILPQPGKHLAAIPNSGGMYTAPRNHFEKKLQEIWMTVLGILRNDRDPGPGIDANFFELGGHSLKATQLVSRIQKELHVSVPVAQLFKTPTIRALSQYLYCSEKISFTAINPLEKKEFYELSSSQKRLFVLAQIQGDEKNVNYNMSGAYIITGKLDKSQLENAVLKIIERHETLRTSFMVKYGGPLQRIHDEIDFKVKYEKCTGNTVEIKEKLKAFVQPFDLSKAPLFKVELLQINKKTHFLFFDLHHIICDGLSMELLVKEFISLYRGDTPEPLPIQYRDYAAWQKNIVDRDGFKAQEQYWLKQLENFQFSQLPADHFDPGRSFEGKKENLIIETSLYNKIEGFCHHYGVTKFTFMLSIFFIVLNREMNQEDISIGIPVVNREQYELKNLIGIFLNIVLLRWVINREDSFLNALSKFKDTVIEAMEHQHYPYELLNYKMRDNRNYKQTELFSILFNYFPIEESTEKLNSEFEIFVYESTEVFPKYDLTLYINEISDVLVLSAVYKSNIYGNYRVKRILNNLLSAIETILGNKKIKISGIITDDFHESSDFELEFEDFYEDNIS